MYLENEEQVFTVFAPTDAAFLALGAGAFNDLISAQSELSDLLLTTWPVPSPPRRAWRAAGRRGTQPLHAERKTGEDQLVDGSDPERFGEDHDGRYSASNGVIHVIDVLLEEPAGEQRSREFTSREFRGHRFGLWEQNLAYRVYAKPSGSEPWAGLQIPIPVCTRSVSHGGKIEFQGGTDFGLFANVYFKFEAPNPDTEPNFTTETITVGEFNGETYTVNSAPASGKYIQLVPVLPGDRGCPVFDGKCVSCGVRIRSFGGALRGRTRVFQRGIDLAGCRGVLKFRYCLAAPEAPTFAA